MQGGKPRDMMKGVFLFMLAGVATTFFVDWLVYVLCALSLFFVAKYGQAEWQRAGQKAREDIKKFWALKASQEKRRA